MKKTIITLGLSLAILSMPFSASAQTITTGKTEAKTANLSNLETKCTNDINMRFASLNKAETRINGLAKLTAAQKQQFISEINSDISGLQAVQTQCTNDFNAGNIKALRADYMSIFANFRVYYVFLPQLHLLIASDTMGVTADKLTDYATKLQDRIQKAGNPSNLTSLLADMQSKIADAEKQYSNVQAQVTPLTPQSWDTNPTGTKAILVNARSEIQIGAADLKAAHADAKQITEALEAETTPEPTATQ
ncbi:MAG TPA: hypothetical protein VF810_00225 [Patescibacteria group bacterium]